jgi:hypothetical protein
MGEIEHAMRIGFSQGMVFNQLSDSRCSPRQLDFRRFLHR